MTTLTKQFDVPKDHSAKHIGSGDLNVLATPALVAYMENTAMILASERLEDGQTTVGIEINLKHLAPSPTGKTVTVTATLTQQKKTILFFDIEAYYEDTLIGTASHKRAIVNADDFMARVLD